MRAALGCNREISLPGWGHLFKAHRNEGVRRRCRETGLIEGCWRFEGRTAKDFDEKKKRINHLSKLRVHDRIRDEKD